MRNLAGEVRALVAEADVWQPLVATLLLHVAVLGVLTLNWSGPSEVSVKPRAVPLYIEATLVDAGSLRPKSPPPKPPTPKERPPRAAPVKPAPAAARPEPKPQASAPEPAQPARPSRAEREAAAQAEFAQALAAEDALLERASDEQLTASYQAKIVSAIEDNWSRPPSARNGMEAELVIQLIPTGEVVSVMVAHGSGLPAFDRSAVLAVEKAERFPELRDLPSRVFERNFRRLRLKFKPEDLRY